MKERLGINAHLPSGATLNLVPAAGIGSIRADFNWPMIQPERHRWEWTDTDHVVHEARTRGIEVFATLAYTPDWANGGQGRQVAPSEVSDWVAFVREVALRYRHNVWHWGLWNEPNLSGFWSGSVEQYVDQIVMPGAAVLHEIGPENRVCGPDLSTEGDWPTWFRRMLERSKGTVDIITVHSYQDNGREVWRALARAPEWWEPWKKPSVRQVIEAAGCSHLPVWLTECGWNTAKVSEAHQADSYDQLLEGLPAHGWVHRVFGYQLQDETNDLLWGIYRQDSTAKPAVEVFRRYGALPIV
jgi:hypothetical protein